MDIIKKHLDEGITLDISGGIYPFLGSRESLSTRNGTTISLDNGIPGTGMYTVKKATGAVTLALVSISVLFVAAFMMLTMVAVNADYSVEKFLETFFSRDNLLYIFLFLAINSFAVFWLYKYKDMLCGMYRRQMERLEKERQAASAAAEGADGIKREILERYARCLELEKQLLEAETVYNALLNHHSPRYSEATENYRERFSALQTQLQQTRFHADEGIDPRRRACYHNLCQSFEVLFTESRFWDISACADPLHGHSWNSTVFCSGMFDYVFSCSYPPMMKTVPSGMLCIYSEYAIHARSTTDFDVIPLKGISMEFSRVIGHDHYGIVRIPELGLAFTSSDPYDLELFVREFNLYRDGKSDPGDFRQLDSLLEETAFYYIIRRKVTNEMIQKHFGIGKTRVRRIVAQLEQLGIISAQNTDGMHELIIWDIEAIRSVISEKSKEYL